MGLPGKPKGIDGAEVERYFHEGKVKEIADYCEGDVVNTYQVWLRYELFRGTLSRDAFEASQQNLSDFMNASSNHKGGERQVTGPAAGGIRFLCQSRDLRGCCSLSWVNGLWWAVGYLPLGSLRLVG
jgi:Predicted 3'-5' exonuclease related to the exonuclease domain of PolB